MKTEEETDYRWYTKSVYNQHLPIICNSRFYGMWIDSTRRLDFQTTTPKWNDSSDVVHWSGEEVIIELVINPSNTAIFPTDCKQNNSSSIAFSSFLSMHIRTHAQYSSTRVTLHNNYRLCYISTVHAKYAGWCSLKEDKKQNCLTGLLFIRTSVTQRVLSGHVCQQTMGGASF